MRPSMGSVGDAYDNAMCESFFATLKCELPDWRRFASRAEARMACFSFIEGWYNPVRLHSALGYRSPWPMKQQWKSSRRNRNHPSSKHSTKSGQRGGSVCLNSVSCLIGGASVLFRLPRCAEAG